MKEPLLFDTREVKTDYLAPWMLGRVVEVSVWWEGKCVRTTVGTLESYSSDPEKYSWTFEGQPGYAQEKSKWEETYGSQRLSYATTKLGVFDFTFTIIVPNNWDHYGVDGSEIAR